MKGKRLWFRSTDAFVFAGLVALLAASTMNGITFEIAVLGRSATIRPDHIVLGALAPLLLVAAIRGKLRFARSVGDLPVVGLVFTNALASLFFSPLRAMSLQGVALLALYASMYFAAATSAWHLRRWSVQLAHVFLAIALVQCAYSFVAFIAFDLGWNVGGIQIGQVTMSSVTVRGTFREANLLAIYMAIVGAFLAVAVARCAEAKRRLAAAAGLCLVAVVISLTVTRSAWLVLVLACMVVTLVSLMRPFDAARRWWAAVLVPLALGLAAVVSLGLVDPVLSRMWHQEGVLIPRAVSILRTLSSDADVDTGVHLQQGSATPPVVPSPSATTARTAVPARVTRRPTPLTSVTGVHLQRGSATPPVVPSPSGTTARTAVPARVTPGPTPLTSVSESSLRSAVGRLQLHRFALSRFLESPLLGHGTFAGEVFHQRYWMGSVVQALCDTGVLGLGFLLWLHFALVVSSWRVFRASRSQEIRGVSLALCLGNTILVVTSQFTSYLWVGFAWVFMGISAGLTGLGSPSRGGGARASDQAGVS